MTDQHVVTAPVVLSGHRPISARVETAWNKTDLGHHAVIYPARPFLRPEVMIPRDIERERILARFLAEPEAAEATSLHKPAMEPECLRTDHGPCHQCGQHGPRWRYEIAEEHYRWLMCDCDAVHDSGGFNGRICTPCANGYGDQEASTACEDISDDDGLSWCRWSEWLDGSPDGGRLPWLCARCWRDVTAAEAEHIARLAAADDAR